MNLDNVHYLNMFLGMGAIVLQIFAVVSLLILFFGPKKNSFFDYLEKHFLAICFLISLIATFFSLVYSEIVHFAPCYLCWYQRIFLFPQVILFGIAFWDKDKKVIRYSLPLLCIGFVFSIYQNLMYYFGETGSVPCDSSGVSCYQQLISEFGGYISFPMLSLTAYFTILVLILIVHFRQKSR
ncbi:MAG: disulfide bond formation protein B [Patescibacteria group bacterium]